ncbi:putative YccA/Bax inhibitor family protein [Prosthecobacter dejongeii]|uniref:Putative YccA/Bax inhibitor family protein n=2 Tax=Prosthecobacter dejongeii TaxID=48465 RepID=A0A7W7YN49_9BACT|nr:Bax inhibitor-1/YccA family protein [Prosthecobacter dejongeii]MBB5039112.1 putative YccA/Bax inhibitor family protein [Prosthecobacter dejongeii]
MPRRYLPSMRTSNPLLNESTFQSRAVQGHGQMTLQGTVNKTAFLLFLTFATAIYTWNMAMTDPAAAMTWVIGGAIAGFVLALITSFKPVWSPVTGSLYALAEGLFLGGLSARYEMQFQGIALQAILLTGGVLLALLAAYSMRLIRATENFKLGIFAATGGIALVYLTTIVLGFFGIQIPYIHDSGFIGIGFSAAVVVIAALNLVLDFDFIENGCTQGAPKYMEWFAAFGLLVTLVWLYVEILRLLSKLARRD